MRLEQKDEHSWYHQSYDHAKPLNTRSGGRSGSLINKMR